MGKQSMAKGIAAEKIVEADLILSGASTFTPSLPITDVDMLALYEGRPYKLQVKAAYSENGRLLIDIRRPSAQDRNYSDDSYDILVAVDLATRKVAYLPKRSLVAGRQVTLFTMGVGEVTRIGKMADYVPVMFDDFSNFGEAVDYCRQMVC